MKMELTIPQFRKKSEILEYLGQDKEYTRYLDRALLSGEVLLLNGMYISRADLIRESFKVLGMSIENMQMENDLLKEKTEDLEERVYEAEANVEYYKEEVKAEAKKNEDIISKLKSNGLIRSASDLLS